MTDDTSDRARFGVDFAEVDGRRSSQASGRTIFADSVREVDEAVARSIGSTRDWRKGYMDGVRDIVGSGAGSSKDALRIASDGLDSTRRALCFVTRTGDATLAEVLEHSADGIATIEVEGRGPRVQELQVPYRGQVLAGDSLLSQLDKWQGAGVIEPSCRDALARVVAHPEWLDLSDRWFVLLGAASEMGPLEPLSRWFAP